MSRLRRTVGAVAVLAVAAIFPELLAAQGRKTLIVGQVDETVLHTLAGNTRPEANLRNDRGAVEDSFPLEHMLLQLRRSPEQEDAVRLLIDELHNPDSPKFHQWMTAEEFGTEYAPAQEDVDKIEAWLELHGFIVNFVYSSGMVIDFSGTAAQVREAFHTSIHYFEVGGKRHIANTSDPGVPAAFAPVVAGVVSMHDFKPHTNFRPRVAGTPHRDYTYTYEGFPYQAVVPADLATIYDLNPLFKSGYTGKGQTVAVIEDTNLYNTADWYTFRSTFGLSLYSSGSLTVVQPAPVAGRNNCGNPGINGDDGEAILDAEWASASAPGASIVVAACADTYSTFGGLIAVQNLVNSPKPPSIMSISYGECEAENGAASNAAYSSVYQQAVAEGVSVFVSAGDEGAASCDADLTDATHGIGVSGFASTAYNVAVGGTDFSDTFFGTNDDYWSSKNSAVYGSALSYIPETPWDDSCAGGLLVSYLGYPTAYGADSFCATSTAKQDDFLTVTAGSGGPSGCASGSPFQYGVIGETCKGHPKPSWQTGVFGVPNDGVRDIPDVSLFAANGLWGHYYVFCFTDQSNGGSPCVGAPSGWAGAGGTSFASPILAGIQALVNQKEDSAQGNPNYVYYKLAGREYGAHGSPACNSSSGPAIGCIFHDVTLGDIAVNCAGTVNCFGYVPNQPGRAFGTPDGALSIVDSSFAPAYATATGWDFATGIGTVDAYNLVMNWGSGH